MRRYRWSIFGLVASCLVVACGPPQPTGQAPGAAPDRGSMAQREAQREAERYNVLFSIELCTPAPGCNAAHGTGTYGSLGETFCFSAVDRVVAGNPDDLGVLNVTIDGASYTGLVGTAGAVITATTIDVSATVEDSVNGDLALAQVIITPSSQRVLIDGVPATITVDSPFNIIPGSCKVPDLTCVK